MTDSDASNTACTHEDRWLGTRVSCYDWEELTNVNRSGTSAGTSCFCIGLTTGLTSICMGFCKEHVGTKNIKNSLTSSSTFLTRRNRYSSSFISILHCLQNNRCSAPPQIIHMSWHPCPPLRHHTHRKPFTIPVHLSISHLIQCFLSFYNAVTICNQRQSAIHLPQSFHD
jgi:hypothetical protein